MAEREKLIELKDLQITFGSGKRKFVAVDHVNFDIYKGETFSLVGESGSGKTTIGRAICRINPTSGGGDTSSRVSASTARSPRNWIKRSSASAR